MVWNKALLEFVTVDNALILYNFTIQFPVKLIYEPFQ